MTHEAIRSEPGGAVKTRSAQFDRATPDGVVLLMSNVNSTPEIAGIMRITEGKP